MLPQDTNPRGGRLDPMCRAHPHPEGEEEEPLHILPAERIHLLRERQTARPIPSGHRSGEGFRRRLERTRPDEAVNRPLNRDSSHPSLFLLLWRATPPSPGDTLSPIASENHVGAFHDIARLAPDYDRANPVPQDSLGRAQRPV